MAGPILTLTHNFRPNTNIWLRLRWVSYLSLLYSSDGGCTVFNKHPEFEKLMKEAAEKLNLAGHMCGLDKNTCKFLYTCADCEGHLGRVLLSVPFQLHILILFLFDFKSLFFSSKNEWLNTFRFLSFLFICWCRIIDFIWLILHECFLLNGQIPKQLLLLLLYYDGTVFSFIFLIY